MCQQFTIQQVSAETGLTVHTLRYYERIAILMPVQRAPNGHRRYSQQDVDRIKLLNRLIATNMPLDQVRRFAMLYLQGDASLPQRITLLCEYREAVARQISELSETLAVIDSKIATYQKKVHQK